MAFVLVSLAACGGDGTFLTDDILTRMHATDVAFQSGDIESACAMLQQTSLAVNDWSSDTRGNLAPVANDAAHLLEGMAMYCRDGDIAQTRAQWQRESTRLKDAARIDSGWGRILWWSLAFGGSVGLGLFIRRRVLG